MVHPTGGPVKKMAHPTGGPDKKWLGSDQSVASDREGGGVVVGHARSLDKGGGGKWGVVAR